MLVRRKPIGILRSALSALTRFPILLNDINGTTLKKRELVSKGDSTKDRILRVATVMFADRGFAAVTTRQIAQKARITMPSLYRYFGDKRSLYLAACGEVLKHFAALYIAELRAPGQPEAKLLRFVADFYHHLLTDRCFAKLLQREIVDRDEKGLHLLTKEHFTDQFRELTNVVTQLTGATGAQQRAFSIYATVFGYLQLGAIGRSAGIAGLRWHNPEAMARVILNQVIPSIDWSAVSAKRVSAGSRKNASVAVAE
jgi:AcrR family transcriptional regulator